MTDTPTFTGRLTFPATDTTDIVRRLRKTASRGVSVWGDLQIEAADTIESQAARIAELQAEKQAAALAHVSLFGELQTALEKQDELEKVAARYRWLRNEAGAMSVFTAAYWNTTTAEQLDAAIDAEMGS